MKKCRDRIRAEAAKQDGGPPGTSRFTQPLRSAPSVAPAVKPLAAAPKRPAFSGRGLDFGAGSVSSGPRAPLMVSRALLLTDGAMERNVHQEVAQLKHRAVAAVVELKRMDKAEKVDRAVVKAAQADVRREEHQVVARTAKQQAADAKLLKQLRQVEKDATKRREQQQRAAAKAVERAGAKALKVSDAAKRKAERSRQALLLKQLRKVEKEATRRREKQQRDAARAAADAAKAKESNLLKQFRAVEKAAKERMRLQKAARRALEVERNKIAAEERRVAAEAQRQVVVARKAMEAQRREFGALSEITASPGSAAFIPAIQAAAVQDEVKLNVACPQKGKKASPYAYQRFVSYAVKPNSPVTRLLAVHRTGAGKTLTMVRILENFYDDPRTKAVVFPNRNLAVNFYSELLSFDNKYRTYLLSVLKPRDAEILVARDRTNKRFPAIVDEVESKLGAKSALGKVGTAGFLAAPIRAYSYGQLGGAQVFRGGKRPTDPLFKRDWGGEGSNPMDHRIVLMDEVHNLVNPGNGCGAHCDNYLNLQEGLAGCSGSVVVGFTATPAPVDRASGDLVMAIICGIGVGQFGKVEPLAMRYLQHPDEPSDAKVVEKARAMLAATRAGHKWDGFTSFFYSQPKALFPGYKPMPCVKVEMSETEAKNYEAKLGKAKNYSPGTRSFDYKALSRMQNYCNIARAPVQQEQKAREFLKGQDLEELSPKFEKIADHVLRAKGKSLIIVHRAHGLVLLSEIMRRKAKELGNPCPGRCFAKLMNSSEAVDEDGVPVESDENKRILEEFNDFKSNSYGEKIKALIIDSKTYSEGVSFFGVTELHIVNPSAKYSTHLQQLGRVFRSCKFVDPKKKGEIRVFVYVSTYDEFMTADEFALLQQDKSKSEFKEIMASFEGAAIDRGLYERWEGQYKTGDEPTCFDQDPDELSDDDGPRVSKKEKKAQAARKAAIEAQKAGRAARLAQRRG